MHRLAPPARALAIGALAGIASFGHVLYPAWLAFKSRGKDDPEPPAPETWPGVTVIVPAYRERAVIAAKVADVLANGYDGPLQVLIVADDPETAEVARKTEADVIVGEDRLGKADAVNRGLEHAQHDLAVLTDANARLQPGALSALVRWFEDASVSAVAGEKRVLDGGEALYWKFESWLKRRESRLGSTIGLVGELAALRKASCKQLPTDLIVDDLWLALDVTASGGRIVYEPAAVASENGSPSLGDEWERRTRNAAGALDAIWRRREMLTPGRSPLTGQLWGHRFVRLSLGPAAHAALLLLALGSARRSRLAALFFLGHVAAALALARKQRGAPLTMPERLLAQTLFLQAVGLWGTVRWLGGDWSAVWHKGERADVLPDAEGSAQ
jgi:cellulose synthase/poly-beta-1,6-N-acetylglucosamine synthase-like glycosyltransferase